MGITEEDLLPQGFGANLNQMWSEGVMDGVGGSFGVPRGSLYRDAQDLQNVMMEEAGTQKFTPAQAAVAAGLHGNTLGLK